MTPFDYVNSIFNKKHYIDDLSSYNPFLTNRALSYHLDTVFYSQEINMASHLSNKMQYDFYYYGVPKGNRIAKKWPKKISSEQLDILSQYYNCSLKKAFEISKILSEQTIDQIIIKFNQGKDN